MAVQDSINLHQALLAALQRQPQKCVLRTPDGHSYTAKALITQSRSIAAALHSLGVTEGDRVLVQIEKSAEVIPLYLAVLQLGAVYVPINTAYTLNETAYFIEDAQPQVVISSPAAREKLEPLAQRLQIPHLESLGTERDGSLLNKAAHSDPLTDAAPVTGEALAAILYTSGTTGRSKGAMLSHGNLLSNTQTLAAAWQFSDTDHLLHALPIFHTHGLFVACNLIMYCGASMTFLPRFDAEQLLDLMPESTVLMGVPTFYTRLLASPRLDASVTRNMRLFISGSAPLLAETHSAFQARTGHAILERYGMTETNMNTSNPYDGARRPGTVGPPLPGIDVRITDRETGHPLPQGETGLIEIKGPNVFQGYWKNPEKTQAEFRSDGYFISGDLGFIDDQGYVHIVGRDKDLIISGGFNVYPKEVEAAIDDLPGVLESAVVGVPHQDFGEAVIAVIVRTAPDATSEAAINASLSNRLARYKQPKAIVFVDELPRNVMGKVQKVALRQAYAEILNPS
jgi:malonyl-CoA/methylmalonyl-CoA synthetase